MSRCLHGLMEERKFFLCNSEFIQNLSCVLVMIGSSNDEPDERMQVRG